ncbi:cation:proton antiporter [Marinomonas sp. 2405UD68-3]|uniref:cation:proton antiporter domain-containing protein n=1 Tax=Marinomonas sp. 2405UD68-3 TaxID=3391835 RepID=UPI0039C97711
MEFIWVLCAFICGLSMRIINMPPLIGFLIAGFFLNYLGVEPSASLGTLANVGITLMLFCIGLKLHVRDLLKPEVWVSALSHKVLWSLVVASCTLFLVALNLPYFSDLDFTTALVIAFALSFSSTVCVMKLFEDAGEMKTRHGQIALGVLVMQDIVAVVFLVFATGKIPTLWAILLFGLLFLKPFLANLLTRVGHGEMLPLAGLFFAFGGYELFYLVGVKGDLGALIMGILLASHSKASELNKALMNFKDIFLIGFFLSIGFTALPTLNMLGISVILSVFLIFKFCLFFLIFTRLRLRGRTAFLTALSMSNYSEFGLIVTALSVDNGWLSKEWLVILALSVSISFVVTSLLYKNAHKLYLQHKTKIKHYESTDCLDEDNLAQPKGIRILVIGLGRVGRGAFEVLHQTLNQQVAGMDADKIRIQKMTNNGDNVFFGDGEDADFWEKMDTSNIELVLLALPTIEDSSSVTLQLRKSGYTGKIAAIARYQDERNELLSSGIDNVFNFYTEAGTGFAEESLQLIGLSNAVDKKPSSVYR